MSAKNWAPDVRELFVSHGWTVEGLPDVLTADQAEDLLTRFVDELDAR